MHIYNSPIRLSPLNQIKILDIYGCPLKFSNKIKNKQLYFLYLTWKIFILCISHTIYQMLKKCSFSFEAINLIPSLLMKNYKYSLQIITFVIFFPIVSFPFPVLSSSGVKQRATLTVMSKNILCFVDWNKSQASKWQVMLLARINIQWCKKNKQKKPTTNKKQPVYIQSQAVLIVFLRVFFKSIIPLTLITSNTFILPGFLSLVLFETDLKCKTLPLPNARWESNILFNYFKKLL